MRYLAECLASCALLRHSYRNYSFSPSLSIPKPTPIDLFGFASMAPRREASKNKGAGHGEPSNLQSEEHLRYLLSLLEKEELIDIVVKIAIKDPKVAEAIGVATSDVTYRKLFVYGFGLETSLQTFCASFSSYGDIENGYIILDKKSGKSRGFGFITFKSIESRRKALETPRKMIDGHPIVCHQAHEGFSRASFRADVESRRLHVAGLSPDTSSEMLLSFFEKHGEIEEGSVVCDVKTTISKGYGFVTYKMAESAKKAITDPYKMLGGRRITVKRAIPRYQVKEIHTQESVNYARSSPYAISPLQSQVPLPRPYVSRNEAYGISMASPTPTRFYGYPYFFSN